MDTSLLDSIALALFAKFKEQIVSQTSSSEGLICTSIKTFEPYPWVCGYKDQTFYILDIKQHMLTQT